MMTDNHFQTLDGLRRDLTALKDSGYTYVEVGALRGISGGLAWNIIKKGYNPKTNRTRAKLNLAPLTAPAPVCDNPDCPKFGQVHRWDCRTQVVKPKPAKTRKRATRIRITADVNKEQQETLHEITESYGGWSEFCRALADGALSVKSVEKSEWELAYDWIEQQVSEYGLAVVNTVYLSGVLDCDRQNIVRALHRMGRSGWDVANYGSGASSTWIVKRLDHPGR